MHSILTLDQLKAALATQVTMTVFRKLRPLAYLSSYSHRGKYYTLHEIARFDQLGLWSHHQVRCSRHRTLINTCAVLVADSEAGYSADELVRLLHVQVKDPLRKLARQESLKIGHGGDRRIAELLGIDAGTVARGRQQLLTGNVQRQRVRRPGGGRHPVEKKRPR